VAVQDPGTDAGTATIMLTERSGQTPAILTMEPVTASSCDASTGTWKEIIDSLGTKTVFVDTATGSKNGFLSFTGSGSAVSVECDALSSTVAPVPMETSSPGSATSTAQAGLLTAGEWNDNKNWRDFQDYNRKYPASFSQWNINLQKRIIIEVKDSIGRLVPGANIKILEEDNTVFEGKTLADGRVAFFPVATLTGGNSGYHVSVQRGTKVTTTLFEPVVDDDQTWSIVVPPSCSMSLKPGLDLAFVVDVTGSMSDELSYIQTELVDICKQVYSADLTCLRVGFVFYRDRGDEFVTRVFEFTDDFSHAQANIKCVVAAGGGDKEESVNLAMRHMIQKLSWRNQDCVRLCFWITDAGPHYYSDEQYTYQDGLGDAVKKGIIINPVAASGMEQNEEYFYRHAAVKTMGRYIYITDNSGIGESHLTPEVGAIDSQKLNTLIENAISEELGKWPKK
jgi:hypothetical protein